MKTISRDLRNEYMLSKDESIARAALYGALKQIFVAGDLSCYTYDSVWLAWEKRLEKCDLLQNGVTFAIVRQTFNEVLDELMRCEAVSWKAALEHIGGRLAGFKKDIRQTSDVHEQVCICKAAEQYFENLVLLFSYMQEKGAAVDIVREYEAEISYWLGYRSTCVLAGQAMKYSFRSDRLFEMARAFMASQPEGLFLLLPHITYAAVRLDFQAPALDAYLQLIYFAATARTDRHFDIKVWDSFYQVLDAQTSLGVCAKDKEDELVIKKCEHYARLYLKAQNHTIPADLPALSKMFRDCALFSVALKLRAFDVLMAPLAVPGMDKIRAVEYIVKADKKCLQNVDKYLKVFDRIYDKVPFYERGCWDFLMLLASKVAAVPVNELVPRVMSVSCDMSRLGNILLKLMEIGNRFSLENKAFDICRLGLGLIAYSKYVPCREKAARYFEEALGKLPPVLPEEADALLEAMHYPVRVKYTKPLAAALLNALIKQGAFVKTERLEEWSRFYHIELALPDKKVLRDFSKAVTVFSYDELLAALRR